MGTFIFSMVVVAEIAFAVFCIITKSNQQKIRNISRIAAFTGFVMFTILAIIDWSSRYYALAALLLLLAIIGGIALIRKKDEKKAYKAVRVVLKAIGMTVLIFTLTLPAIIFPQHKAMEVTGKYKVATITHTYTDTKRVETYTDTGENRKLNVQLWYPENADGTYPLIVFSHGGISTKSSNESLYNELASQGYVVCSIDHTYQCLSTKDEDGSTTRIDRGYMQECSAENARADRQKSYEYYQKWMKIRTGDIDFVIDHILSEAENKNADIAYKLIDTSKIGVMGHSLGGSAALGIGRMRDDVSAVIALESPFMYDIEGVKEGEFVFKDEIYPVPVLNVYSDSSWSNLAQWPQYAENYALLSGTNATAFNVHMSGVGHFTLTDLALTSPLLTRLFNGKKSTTSAEYCLKTINKICLEFFDSYLKGKGEFLQILKNRRIKHEI
ncbi:acetylxylan esterase [Clostridium bowmanii]|uniref:alpha/beta hydrolase family protein n=1 Tax=Clostridium bowmanii TaxID=132925 RepID=UPI001C0C4275|nr:acetylxylan esterase [Clostridium bowmanii]MBU3192209.1 acetylxylan esterase [Clostridium bowmanii]MCA1076431.1 acetylxylan esterase [Clostridium bowmanii]